MMLGEMAAVWALKSALKGCHCQPVLCLLCCTLNVHFQQDPPRGHHQNIERFSDRDIQKVHKFNFSIDISNFKNLTQCPLFLHVIGYI